jgi:hypothetical protein
MASITKGRKSNAGTNVIEHDPCEDYLFFAEIQLDFHQKVRNKLQHNIKNSIYVHLVE